MKQQKRRIFIITLLFCFILVSAIGLFSREFDFIPLDAMQVSTYNNDRVVYQRIEKSNTLLQDNSFEALLIIRDRKMYMMMDGRDSAADAKTRKFKAEVQKVYGENEGDLIWTNKINGKPDFIQIIDRRTQVMVNANEEFVSTNFGTFYKSIRDKFIKEHVDKFHQIMRNRREADFYIERKPLRRSLYVDEMTKYVDRFYTFVRAKAFDGTMYSCEDADGDGVTETFIVHGRDGFDWGYNSGPNLLFIYKNTDKDIETLVGKLANEAVYGSVEDEKEMIETFPKERIIDDLIKWLTPKDPNIK
jgi:hypothetical protein